jgi:anti-sigma factor RsiW
MNCQRFKDQLFEYVEGSLSADARAAADQHLARCDACRQAVRQERQVAQALADRFQQATGKLVLRPQIRSRIVAVSRRESAPRPAAAWWHRLAWPVGIAACLLLAAAFVLAGRFRGARVDPAVSIQVSYRVPIHKFRQEGGLVLDTVSYETIAINETLIPAKPSGERPKSKMPL